MQNTAAKKRAGQEDEDSDYLFGSFLRPHPFRCNDRADPNWLVGYDREELFRQPLWTYATEVVTRLHTYGEVRAYLEKEHPDWLRALTPRRIKTPADYWPHKVLSVSSANAAMQNCVSIHERRTRPNPALMR